MAKAKSQRKTPLQGRSKAMVAALIEAAIQIFSSSGFNGASTNAIAERAGVSIGSLYQYFPDKRALLEAVNERYIIGLWQTASNACRIASALPWPQALRYIVTAKVEYHIKDSRLFEILNKELPMTFPVSAEATQTALQLQKELRNFLVAHQTMIRVDIDRAVQMLPVIAKGVLVTSFLSNPDDLKSRRIVDEVTKVLNHYLTEPELSSAVTTGQVS